MCDSKDLGDPGFKSSADCVLSRSEEEMFGDGRVTKKYTGLLRGSKILPGCLTQAQLPLLLLLVSVGFFLLLVANLVQVSSLRQSLQKEKWDHQQSPSQVGVSQKPPRSDLDEILQQLTWMNATLAGLCRPCPWKWELFQGNCYFFSQTQNVWKDAISACQNLGAQLVIINSMEEQKFLKSWNTKNNQRTWIGLSDHHNEGSWKWLDNSPLQLSFWKEGEPNNHGDEDCVELYSEGWNDNRCSSENFWTCEKPSSPCPGS
ncbi:CD209-like protein [Gulo gulo luscus]|nr:CD209-like protein [Gulo gulo luscus]KAI5758653.1 CD209-like protein [Gulo gulo luscus]UQT06055.1 CD209 [Gulo gulo luscus]